MCPRIIDSDYTEWTLTHYYTSAPAPQITQYVSEYSILATLHGHSDVIPLMFPQFTECIPEYLIAWLNCMNTSTILH